MISIHDKRPPFVRFETKEYGLNAQASEEAGRPIPNVAVFACITPFGSKDVFEKVADEWLADIKRKAAKGEYPYEWVQQFTAQYAAWKDGHELPREGTPIATWQLGTAEQRARLRALGITTVEDLAQTPDSGLGVIGLDGRALRDQAKAWIAEAKDKGIVARELAAMNVKNDELTRQNQELREEVRALLARVEQLEGSAEGAPPAKGRRSAA